MTRAAFAALLSHWRRKPGQLAVFVLGLALATALWSGVQAINAEARTSYDRAAETLSGGGLESLRSKDGGPIDEATYIALRRAGWLVSPVVEGRIGTEAGPLRLVGVDPLTAPSALAGPTQAQPTGDAPSAFFTPPGRLIVAPETAERLAEAALPPLIAAEGVAPGLALLDIGIAQRLLGTEGTVTRLILLPQQPRGVPPLDRIAPDLVRDAPANGADLGRLTDSFHLNLTAFGLLSFVVGLFIVHGAVGLAFEQRRPVFRTLRALGVPARRLVALLVAELLVLATAAGALGVALGYLIAALLLPDVAATLRGLYGASVEGTLTLRPAWWLGGFAVAIAGALVSSAQSLYSLARLPILTGAQPRAWAMAGRRTRWVQLIAAAGLALAAVAAGTLGSGLVAGFVLLGALLMAGALALPPLLAAATALGERAAQRPISLWFWADTRQQLPGLSLAVMALLLALAANIGVGTMVSSFRSTFVGWLDQRLASELYVTTSTEAEAERLTAWLAPRTDAILPIWNTTTELAGAPAQVFGVADHATYRDNWPLIAAVPGVWDAVAAGDAVLINEQLSLREDLGPGDPVTLSGWTAPIAGVYSDYGNPQGQAIVSVPRLLALDPDVSRLRYGLRIAPDRAADLARDLVQDFGLDPEQLTEQSAIKGYSLEVFDRTFTVTGALNVLTLGVAGLAILTSLLTLHGMRLPQLAPLWALGLTRARLARLEVARAVLLAALTMLAALPLGLLLAWVLLTVINVQAFGWRLPMQLFPLDWGRLALLALVAAGAAALLPAARLARIPPAQLLRVFSSER